MITPIKRFALKSWIIIPISALLYGLLSISTSTYYPSVAKLYFNLFKDGAYYCYCAYVLRISRYSDFLSVMLTNAGIFLRGLNYAEKVDLSKYYWYPKRKLGVTMHYSEIIKLQFDKKRHTWLCILKLFTNIVHELSLKNAWLPPIFFFDFNNIC